MSFVIYTCECGNYVSQPTIDGSRATLPGYVEVEGLVVCRRPVHGLDKPQMRRILVEQIEDAADRAGA